MENNKQVETPEIKKNKRNNVLILSMGAFLIALISFSAGVKVGLIKARFSYHWGENYERNFVGPHPPMNDMMRGPENFLRGPGKDDFRNAHGLAGTIISITPENIIVKDRDEKENTVTISEKTVIRKFRNNLKITDLNTSDKIVVLGRPSENGTIEADLIRVFENN